MIERIKSDEEIRKLIKISENDAEGKILACARLTLTSDNVQKWIREGKFKHLKNELNIYNNVKFGCLKSKYSCQYYFFGNKNAMLRILNLLSELFEDKQVHLKDCKSDNGWYKSKYNDEFVSTRGEFNACPLF